MLPLETVGNPGLEGEYLASRILHGNINDPRYLNLRMDLAGLSFVDASQELTELLTQIKKMVVGNQGLIDRPVVKKLYFDDAPELTALIEKAHAEVTKLSYLYNEAQTEKLHDSYFNMQGEIETAPMTYEDIGQIVNSYTIDNDEVAQLGQTKTELDRMEASLRNILTVSSKDNPKLSSKEIPANLSVKYKLFLTDLTNNLDVATDNIQISMVVSKGLDAITTTLPADDLDPFTTDVCNNIISALTDPESFYSKCKNDEIISPVVGQMFGHSYPEYYSKYSDIFMEDYEGLSYQAVLDFKKCFGLSPDDSELVSLCSQYVKLGFTQPQQ